MKYLRHLKLLPFCCLLFFAGSVIAQEPYRSGTTAVNFLEIGYGPAGQAVGDAYVSMANDISSIYWNPAGLGYMKSNEFQAAIQPWFADIDMTFLGFGVTNERVGSFAVGVIAATYGDEEVTTVDSPEGTGETFDGQDLSVSLSYSRRLVNWFSVGLTGKYINSRIINESGSAFALDLGTIIKTGFLAHNGDPATGLTIGMSISNYGSRIRYTGLDLQRPIDIAPNEDGNFSTVPAVFDLESWELPLIFRLGISFNPIYTGRNRFTMSVNALHPNNNSESVNLGGEYQFIMPSIGVFTLRGGYKGLFLVDSEYGYSFGAGLKLNFVGQRSLGIDYAYRDIGLLGYVQSYSISLGF